MPGQRYAWDQLLWSPSWYEVDRSLHDAVAYANRARVRGRLDGSQIWEWWSDVGEDWPGLEREPFLWEYATATPTLRTYREGGAVIGAAWWRAKGDAYFIRIVADDVQANGARELRRKIQPFGLTPGEFAGTHPLALCVPALYLPPFPRKVGGLIGQVGRALREQPTVAAWWQHYADLCEDAGAVTAARDARRALEMVLHLGAHRGMILN